MAKSMLPQPRILSIPDFVKLIQLLHETWFLQQPEDNKLDAHIQFLDAVISEAHNQIEALKDAKVNILRQMDYQDYLQTDHWKAVRKMMLKQSGHRCQLCNASDRVLHVHHRSYENRGRETYTDLIVLCSVCHGQFHEKLGLSR